MNIKHVIVWWLRTKCHKWLNKDHLNCNIFIIINKNALVSKYQPFLYFAFKASIVALHFNSWLVACSLFCHFGVWGIEKNLIWWVFGKIWYTYMQQTLQNTAVWGELVKLPCNCGKIQEWHRLFDGVLNIKWKPFRQFWQARLTIYLHKFWFFIQLIIFGVLPWYIYAMPSAVIVQTWLLNHFLYMCFLIVSSTSKMQAVPEIQLQTKVHGPMPSCDCADWLPNFIMKQSAQ